MKTALGILLFCLSFINITQAQTNRIAILEKKIAVAKQDTSKINLLLTASELLQNTKTRQSINYAKEALAISSQINNEFLIIKSLLQISRSEATYNRITASTEYLKQAIEYAKESDNDFYKHWTTNEAGKIYKRIGNSLKALELFIESIDYFESIEDYDTYSEILVNISTILIEQRQYEEAFTYLDKTKNILKKIKSKIVISSIYLNYAISNFNLKQLDKAETNLKNALHYVDKKVDSENLCIAYTYLGLIFFNKDDNKAFDYFEDALKIAKNIQNKYLISFNYYNLGNYYYNQKQYDKTISFIDKSYNIAKQIKNKELQFKCTLLLSEYYHQNNFNDLAYKYFKRSLLLKDSIYYEYNTRVMHQSLQNIEINQKDVQLLSLKKQKRIQTIVIIIFSFAFIIITFLIYYIIKSNRSKKAANLLLFKQNLEMIEQKKEANHQAELLAVANAQLEKINQELELVSLVAKNTNNSVIIADENANIEWVNNGFINLYGYTLEEFCRERGSNIIQVSQNNNIINEIKHCIIHKEPYTYTSQNRTKNNQIKYIQTTLNPIVDAYGDLQKIVAIETDITIIKEAENKITLQKEELENEKKKSDDLLLNILPLQIAEELKKTGKAKVTHYESATVLFTDFKGFTQIAEKTPPEILIKELDKCFAAFDDICVKYNIEKIKTIGDAFMCAGGIPVSNNYHPFQVVLAGLEFRQIIDNINKENANNNSIIWNLRVGINTGPVIAGVVGKKKFAYDIWGDTVNTASRMESSGEPHKINISGSTYEIIKNLFDCEYRGKILAKNKGEIDMYFVHKIKDEYSENEFTPNKLFWSNINFK